MITSGVDPNDLGRDIIVVRGYADSKVTHQEAGGYVDYGTSITLLDSKGNVVAAGFYKLVESGVEGTEEKEKLVYEFVDGNEVLNPDETYYLRFDTQE